MKEKPGHNVSKTPSQRRPVIIGVLAVVCIAILTKQVIAYNSPVNRLSRQLDLGQKYLEEQNYEQAIVEFDKAIAINPMSTDAYLGKAEAYIGTDDYGSAIETYKAALERLSEGNMDDPALIDAEPNIEKIRDAAEQAYLNYAQKYINTGDYDTAIQILQEGYALLGGKALSGKYDEISKEKSTKELQEVKQILNDLQEELTNVRFACNDAILCAYLSDEQIKELCMPLVDVLEQYKDIWIENRGLSTVYGEDLCVFYYAMKELEKCLETRKELYAKVQFESYRPEEWEDESTGDYFNEYGRPICLRGSAGGQYLENVLDKSTAYEYTQDGRISSITEHSESEDETASQIADATITYEADATGRVVRREERRKWTVSRKGKTVTYEDIEIDTYEYKEDIVTIGYHLEFYENGILTSSGEDFCDYPVSQYGKLGEGSEHYTR